MQSILHCHITVSSRNPPERRDGMGPSGEFGARGRVRGTRGGGHTPSMEKRDAGGESPERCAAPGSEDPEKPEFEDEAPGAVLLELKPHPFLIGWALLDLGGVGILGILALLGLRWGGAGLPLAIIWIFLPVLSILGLLFTAFMRLNLPAAAPPNRLTRWAFGLQLLALGAWMLLAWGAHARFVS